MGTLAESFENVKNFKLRRVEVIIVIISNQCLKTQHTFSAKWNKFGGLLPPSFRESSATIQRTSPFLNLMSTLKSEKMVTIWKPTLHSSSFTSSTRVSSTPTQYS